MSGGIGGSEESDHLVRNNNLGVTRSDGRYKYAVGYKRAGLRKTVQKSRLGSCVWSNPKFARVVGLVRQPMRHISHRDIRY